MGYQVRVNGESVWESEGDATAVDRVSVMTSRGEAGAIGSAPDNEWIDILINVRNKELTGDLDLLEAERRSERRERLEGAGPDAFDLTGAADAQRGSPVNSVAGEEDVTPEPRKSASRKSKESQQTEEDVDLEL